MIGNKPLALAAALLLVGFFPQALPGQDPDKPPVAFSGSLQTGVAEVFQLTLGGRFGQGPALQKRLQLNFDHVVRRGDRFSIQGWNTHDLRGHSNDWVAGFRYRPGNVRHRGTRSQFNYGFGLERWRFPSVVCGTQDWLVAADVAWASSAPLQPWANSEYWSNFHSNMPRGHLLYSQGGIQHRLYARDAVRLVYRHGAAYTQAWGLYGKEGPRVIRYTGTLVADFGRCALEAGIRPQQPLQAGIPRNTFWVFSYTQRFGRR